MMLRDNRTGGEEPFGDFQAIRGAPRQPQSPVTNQPEEALVEEFGIQFQQGSTEVPEDMDGDGIVQFAATPVSTGLLSLRFDIPTDGERLDFERTGGNAALTLNVRSAESLDWLQGTLWAVGCFVGLLMVLRALKAGDSATLVSRFAMIFAIVGITGWFLLPSNLSVIALLLGIAGSVVLCGTEIKRSFRTGQQNA